MKCDIKAIIWHCFCNPMFNHFASRVAMDRPTPDYSIYRANGIAR